eukprot:m.81812 g.81812  ORF g.81812 m.81812 type:complete len:106 (+) comp12069_c3_seq1:1345-1662(+)
MPTLKQSCPPSLLTPHLFLSNHHIHQHASHMTTFPCPPPPATCTFSPQPPPTKTSRPCTEHTSGISKIVNNIILDHFLLITSNKTALKIDMAFQSISTPFSTSSI